MAKSRIQAGAGNEIRCHQGDPEAECEHGCVDGVAYLPEHAGVHQRGGLLFVHADSPRIAHLELRVHRRRDAGRCDSDSAGLDPDRAQHADGFDDFGLLQDWRD